MGLFDSLKKLGEDLGKEIEKGKNSTWQKNSADGLEFVIKRNAEDEETIHAFSGVAVDDKAVLADNFDVKEGSLILTLKPDYLNTLEVGKHELVVHFGEIDAITSFTIEEKSEEQPKGESQSTNPKTGDEAILYIVMFGVSIMGITYTGKRKYN